MSKTYHSRHPVAGDRPLLWDDMGYLFGNGVSCDGELARQRRPKRFYYFILMDWEQKIK
ncbi:MAG: hypothetical protein F6J87_03670 [Spirulina sp. SIO3F2]|nr:hypothetical protein [Spirulina sp. SIO3F2]